MKLKKLSEVIEHYHRKCGDNKAIISGVDINKQFIPTRANLEGTDVSGYYLVPPRHFACNLMHIGRDERIPIAYNSSDCNYVVTSAYYVFRIKQTSANELLDEYLYIIFNSNEFDRLTWFYSDSSIRGNLKEERFLDIEIPLPSLSEQQKVVNAWKALREIKEQNEAIAAPLMQMCQSYIQELKHKYDGVEIGQYLEEITIKNSDNQYGVDFLRGVTSDGVFDYSKAKTDGLKFDNYKIVKRGNFAYNPSRINLGSISLCELDTCIISPMYIVFQIIEKYQDVILPDFLNLWFRRSEFQRSTLFFAAGSVRDTFDFPNMKKTRIPLPPIEKQRAIVNVYNCANEAKRIAAEADRMSREVCPALIQHVIHN